MPKELNTILTRIESEGVIVEDDIIALRRVIYGDNHVARNEIDRLFDANNSTMPKSDTWPDFFVAAITNFLVHQSRPVGYVDEDTAKWFIERISTDGHIETETELRALMAVLRDAKDATDALVEFALEEVKSAILNGEGQIARNRSCETCHISLEDVRLIDQVLYASGGDDHIKVTRKEAEILFDLNDACTPLADAAEAWQSIFVNAITNCMMFHTPFQHPTREEALRQENWLKARGDLNIGGLIHQVSLDKMLDTVSGRDRKAEAQQDLIEAEIIKRSERIDGDEALWLTQRIARDGVLNDNERALLKHIENMSPDIHDTLKPYIQAA